MFLFQIKIKFYPSAVQVENRFCEDRKIFRLEMEKIKFKVR